MSSSIDKNTADNLRGDSEEVASIFEVDTALIG